jgi:hypothetical protein
MRRIDERPQQADRERLNSGRSQLVDRGLRASDIEGYEHLAGLVHALGDGANELRRHNGRRRLHQVRHVDLLPLGEPRDLLAHAADGDGLLMALRHDEAGANAAALGQSVSAHRRAVHKGNRALEERGYRRVQAGGGSGQTIHDADGRIRFGGQRFGKKAESFVSLQHAVGEGAADVHSDLQVLIKYHDSPLCLT